LLLSSCTSRRKVSEVTQKKKPPSSLAPEKPHPSSLEELQNAFTVVSGANSLGEAREIYICHFHDHFRSPNRKRKYLETDEDTWHLINMHAHEGDIVLVESVEGGAPRDRTKHPQTKGIQMSGTSAKIRHRCWAVI